MDYLTLTDLELRDHLRQIEIILKERGNYAPALPIPLKVLLIVDDEFQILNLLEETFNIGYHVITATSVSLAIKAAIAKPPDIAIVDWVLNGETGGSLCLELHKLYPKLPIIILSAYAVTQETALDFGAKVAMKKPYSPMKLATVMRELLEEAKGIDNPPSFVI